MSRRIIKRLILEGELVAETPFHVGSGTADRDTELALARKGSGQLYIPGTSIAGPVRSLFNDAVANNSLADDCEDSELTELFWGCVPPKGSGEIGSASLLEISDAQLSGSVAEPYFRDGVGIDRYTGAAAEGIKFDRELLPAGTRFEFQMRLNVPEELSSKSQDLERGFREVADILVCSGLRFGGGKSRGLGRLKLVRETLKMSEIELNRKASVLDLIRNDNAASPVFLTQAREEAVSPDSDCLNIDIDWCPAGPLMVKAAAASEDVDILPLSVTHAEEQFSLVMPGSSIKGPLRSHSERVLATALNLETRTFSGHKLHRRFLDQLELPKLWLAAALYGSAKRDTEQSCPEIWPGQSSVFPDDCHSLTRFDKGQLERMLEGGAAKQAYGERLETATHVGIDRWTGGAAEGFLYTATEPWHIRWEALRMKLSLSRLQRRMRDIDPKLGIFSSLALFWLTLDDFSKGRIPLGFGTTRGYGQVKVNSISITAEDSERLASLLGFQGHDLAQPVFSWSAETGWNIDPRIRQRMASNWRNFGTRYASGPFEETVL